MDARADDAAPVTARLGAFAAEMPADGIPRPTRAMMRLSLFDWAVCGIAGRDEPVARITRGLALADGGAAEASVIGAGPRLPVRAAALVNGATSHALDYDDTHFAHIGHPSVAVIPAALALAERTGADGAALLDAALVGVEASVRVGVWLGRGHYQTGFHQTATAGTFGAAAAAARLLGLDAGRAAHALGLAATRAAGLKSQFGTMGKPYNAGIAAQSGTEAALLAAAGFVSTPEGIEGEQGFGPTHAGAADPAGLAGLGTDWLFDGISHKFHACCHGTHAMLEALGEIAGQGVAPGGVAAVTVTTHPRWLRVCNQPAPRTGLEAKFSYRLTAAMALAGRDTGALDTFGDRAASDPALVALRDKVTVETDETLPETAARVSVWLSDGQRLEAAHDLAAPMRLETRQAKLRAKGAALLGAEGAERLWSAVTAGDVAALAELLRQPA
ncbi:MmgE/PrpD family protein [Rhodovulum sp. YNF3179]|uniref:MmgE/PrpD family protein n=1 Tax=Rhodovulum sp. YNF3179 TaxID=3425127 RepID=UPI003D3556AD